jgi:hypothetical protein
MPPCPHAPETGVMDGLKKCSLRFHFGSQRQPRRNLVDSGLSGSLLAHEQSAGDIFRLPEVPSDSLDKRHATEMRHATIIKASHQLELAAHAVPVGARFSSALLLKSRTAVVCFADVYAKRTDFRKSGSAATCLQCKTPKNRGVCAPID